MGLLNSSRGYNRCSICGNVFSTCNPNEKICRVCMTRNEGKPRGFKVGDRRWQYTCNRCHQPYLSDKSYTPVETQLCPNCELSWEPIGTSGPLFVYKCRDCLKVFTHTLDKLSPAHQKCADCESAARLKTMGDLPEEMRVCLKCQKMFKGRRTLGPAICVECAGESSGSKSTGAPASVVTTVERFTVGKNPASNPYGTTEIPSVVLVQLLMAVGGSIRVDQSELMGGHVKGQLLHWMDQEGAMIIAFEPEEGEEGWGLS